MSINNILTGIPTINSATLSTVAKSARGVI